MTHTDLAGVLVALVTPFTADGSEIDAAALEAHTDMVHRFVAGNKLEDAVQITRQLNHRRIGGILDLLGEGVTDSAGATDAAAHYRESAAVIPARGLDATISVKLSQLGLTIDRRPV